MLRQFTFSWQFYESCNMKPRGGTTKGAKLELADHPHDGWLRLQEKGINQFEKDRRAILAMAGAYRTSFDFIEVMGFTPDYKPDSPYQSWGTEYVYVVEDQDDFISLQHIMVMFFEVDGVVSEPMVMKHWRQDWHFEKEENLLYKGHGRFEYARLPTDKVRGSWSQSVFQVDDSPRYESYGYWEHKPNFSTWLGAQVWRPLPRREFSVRNDYHALEGTNRHTILPAGWVHEQENYKVVLDKNGLPDKHTPFISKELGVNRYDLIQNFDFSAGDQYWEETGDFWADVRNQWQAMFKQEQSFVLKNKVDGRSIYMEFFEYAEENRGDNYNSAEGKVFIAKTINRFIEK